MHELKDLGSQISSYTSFKVHSKVQQIYGVSDFDLFIQWLKKHPNQPFMILGGGSNVLFSEPYQGVVFINQTKGIKLIEDSENDVLVEVQSGEDWHQFVSYCVERGWFGIENLALIPGTVGAAPIQNIGAYGVELSDVLVSVEVYDRSKNCMSILTKDELNLSYRNSIFKEQRHRFIIKSVQIKLHKDSLRINNTYKSLAEYLISEQILTPTTKDIYDAVIEVRTQRLPKPEELGNAGSFFKNPVLGSDKADKLKARFPEIPLYPVENGFKTAAGWLIDKVGLKGYRVGDAGTYHKQALVLVNHAKATGSEMWNFAQMIQAKVKDKFDIKLEAEVNIVGQHGIINHSHA